MTEAVLLKVDNITKTFPGVRALDGVSLTLKRGTVHALCGENGAGKSTFMHILIGMYAKDSGEIIFQGKKVDFSLPKQALDAGISIIEQELTPIYDMTVAENIFLGREPVRSGFIDYPRLNRMATEVLAELDVQIDPAKKMKYLSLAEIQLVEIAKAISYDSEVIIMDEPTSAIGEKEVDNLFKIIRLMKAKGKGILYVSHRLKEVFTIADEVTVLRDGRHVATESIQNIDPNHLVSLMVGRKIGEEYVKESRPVAETALSVKNLSRRGKFRDISLELKKGEVLGVFGLMGSGRSEFLQALFGYDPADEGEISIAQQPVRIAKTADAIRQGLALVTEDRKKMGLVLTQSVKENISLASLKRLTRRIFINRKAEKNDASEMIAKFAIKTAGMEHLVKNLSGGNQQKVLLGRCLLTAPQILLLDEPTRGIDVGAKREIYKFISDYTQSGKAVIMVSSEIPEILSMSDRIIIFKNGRITGELSKCEATQEILLHLAS
ncbi:monosaccharide ABC transporter ATP-binding protein (CUT2 family) [Hydrogenispora ethanolica]|uniref:Monosaccharide ABC transporter ATP-binding protein (CUT2 family) n=1 Tax=Hydrogenispora ethanolica TaxID=1082276 RepID=A0A4R1R1R4_HYDET|nr:sugar ABC transporter ATP-binding protein [Hydrogenispora ethanolica]TCL59248.1 monosaccharide ABC transporter ATP-binding protein (CUT2 family) [Hydrogenispora ethanolica]